MPCAAINNVDDRDYIKSLKTNVLVGNDDEEKACLCQCKVPTTSEGCPILDENNKVGLFPFCIPLVNPSSVGANTAYPVKMKLNQVMDLFWAKNIMVNAFVVGSNGMISNACGPNTKTYVNFGIEDTLMGNNEEQGMQLKKTRKQLLCGDFSKRGASEFNGGKVSRCGRTNYDPDCGGGLYFGVTASFFNGYGVYPEIVKTTDNYQNVDFYPRMGLYMNLGGSLAGGAIWSSEGDDPFGSSQGTVRLNNQTLEVTMGGGRYQSHCSNPPPPPVFVSSNLINIWKITADNFVP